MDLRDFQIFLELSRSPFASHEAIGRQIGVTGAAVKARLDRMSKQGVLQGFQVVPIPQVFRRHWHISAYFGVDPRLELKDLLDVEHVVTVWRGGHGEVMVNTFDPTPVAKPPSGLSALIGQPPAQVVASIHRKEGQQPTPYFRPSIGGSWMP
jgi:DNA-binding Lrp family transcriptional regulator